MELKEAILERRSIRAFTDRPVPRGVIEDTLTCAIRAPSALNLQPWEFVLAIGEERRRLSRRLLQALNERRVSCAPETREALPPRLEARIRDSFKPLRALVDGTGRSMSDFINEGSCDFYGAPVAVIICLDEALSKTNLLSIGICAGYLLLAAHEKGLGTCPIGLVRAFADEIREQLNIPGTKEPVLGIALGYPDWNATVNRFVAPRDEISRAARWID